jgi:hypothetical protein
MHSSQDTEGADPDPEFGVDISLDRKEKADSVEGQFLFRSPAVKVIGGAGFFDIDFAVTLALDISFLGLTNINTNDKRTKHANLYAYSYIALPANLTLTLGVSGDLFDETGESSQSNPDLPTSSPEVIQPRFSASRTSSIPGPDQLGVESGTTLRAAWTRRSRDSGLDQTLNRPRWPFSQPQRAECYQAGLG